MTPWPRPAQAVQAMVTICFFLSACAPEGAGPVAPAHRSLHQPAAAAPVVPYQPGHLLVKFQDPAQGKTDDELVRGLGLERARPRRLTGVDLMRIRTGESVPEAAARIARDPRVAYAEPNHRLELTRSPNELMYSLAQWSLNNTGQTGGINDVDVDAPEAWDITVGSRDVIVAVSDSGVNYYHQDLAANMWINEGEIPANGLDDDGNGYVDDVHGWDFYSDDRVPLDINADGNHPAGHGTGVAALIGAVTDNGWGMAGMAWRVRLMPTKVFGSTSSSDAEGFALDAAEGMLYAVNQGARIINCSWKTPLPSQTLSDAVTAAEQAEVLIVASAGNDAVDVDLPANEYYPCEFTHDNVICVAAINHFGVRASFSNWGATSVDLAAPGQDILTANMNGAFFTDSGTSFSAPLVSGAAALLLTANPALSASELRQHLMDSVDGFNPSLSGITVTGGRLNAHQALLSVGATPLPPVAIVGAPAGHQPLGGTVVLDGSESFDANQDPIDFAWTLSPPGVSAAALDDPAAESPRFVIDRCGAYAAELTVTDDGGLTSSPAGATVYALHATGFEGPVESDHSYGIYQHQAWTFTVPGAAELAVRFSDFATEIEDDLVRVADGAGQVWGEYSGNLGGFDSAVVPGDTLVLTFDSDGHHTGDFGFVAQALLWCDGAQCPAGSGDCNADGLDGCEVSLADDPQHCGLCGRACDLPNAVPACVGGGCQVASCAPGFTDCDGDAATGCEVDLLSDPAHCGACDNPCGPYDNASPGCRDGQCAIGACDLGWDDCNGELSDGCEFDVSSDVDNCGACGVVCALDHVTAHACQAGVCTPAESCQTEATLVETPHPYLPNTYETYSFQRPGAASLGLHFSAFETEYNNDVVSVFNGLGQYLTYYTGDLGAFDSIQVPGDTVELTLYTNGSVQAYGFVVDGLNVCQPACAADYADCDATPDNGCEIWLGSPDHCGACGGACAAGEVCAAGAGGYACDSSCADADGDGHPDSACGGDDCADDDATVFPGAAEVCGDGIDQDCADGDEACPCPDADLDGHLDQACGGDDCADTDPTIFPGATEICGDGIDQDCADGDEACPCEDQDGDGHPAESCGGDDCDDTDANAHPGATEICGDGIDQDCVGGDQTCACDDQDGDGYAEAACGGDDCDDANPNTHPGATEICGDGFDQDCDGADLPCTCQDADGDGHQSTACGGDDCDDGDAAVHPGASEICGDGIDQDCAGGDQACPCQDEDGDGHPDAACGGDDCDDGDPAAHPGGSEICDDGVDQDCSGADLECAQPKDDGGSGCGCAAGGESDGILLLPFLALMFGALRRRTR